MKGGGDRVVDWIWRLCNMTFDCDFVSGDCICAVIVPLYKGISLLSMVGKNICRYFIR